MKTRNSRDTLFPLWAGLLILGSLAPLFAGADDRTDDRTDNRTDDPSVRIADGLVSLTVSNVPVGDIIQAIAAEADLRLVQHVVLDRLITLSVEEQPLPNLLSDILKDDSYQLFQRAPGGGVGETGNPVPGTLWIFSEGSPHATAAAIFFEAVLLHGSLAEKKEAIRELRRLATPDAVQTLSLALGDDDTRVRDAAMQALARIGSDEALAAVASASIDSDPWVRSEAANALSSGNTGSAVQYLNLALADPDPGVRMSVIEALSDIPTEQAVATLSLALQDDDPDVRMHAADALEEVGDEIAFRTFMKARADDEPDVPEAYYDPSPSLEPER